MKDRSIIKASEDVEGYVIKELREIITRLQDDLQAKEQKVEEIISILEYYANTTMGELQADGTYKYLLNENSITGKQYLTYDPRPAKKALQKCNEVLDD